MTSVFNNSCPKNDDLPTDVFFHGKKEILKKTSCLLEFLSGISVFDEKRYSPFRS